MWMILVGELPGHNRVYLCNNVVVRATDSGLAHPVMQQFTASEATSQHATLSCLNGKTTPAPGAPPCRCWHVDQLCLCIQKTVEIASYLKWRWQQISHTVAKRSKSEESDQTSNLLWLSLLAIAMWPRPQGRVMLYASEEQPDNSISHFVSVIQHK